MTKSEYFSSKSENLQTRCENLSSKSDYFPKKSENLSSKSEYFGKSQHNILRRELYVFLMEEKALLPKEVYKKVRAKDCEMRCS